MKKNELPFPKVHRLPRDVTTLAGKFSWSKESRDSYKELSRLNEVKIDMNLALLQNQSKLIFLKKEKVNHYRFFLQRSGEFFEYCTTTTNAEYVVVEAKIRILQMELDNVNALLVSQEDEFIFYLEKDATPPEIDGARLHKYGLSSPPNDVDKLQYGLLKLSNLSKASQDAYNLGRSKIEQEHARKKSQLEAQQQAENIRESLGTNLQSFVAPQAQHPQEQFQQQPPQQQPPQMQTYASVAQSALNQEESQQLRAVPGILRININNPNQVPGSPKRGREQFELE